MNHILDEIDQRVADLVAAAHHERVTMLPPLLALGTSERVGSNWLSDMLRATMPQHNEPFRQQVGADHPLSAVNPHAITIDHLPQALLGPLGWHWLVTFTLSKYGPVRHLLKETNLFFATGTLLRLFPEAPVVVLSRSPLGVASSFARSNLFSRWDYAARYRQMLSMTAACPCERFRPLVPDDNPDPLEALTRLTVLNGVLLADALDGREYRHLRYETAVLDPESGTRAVGDLIPPAHPRTPATVAVPAVDDTFSTINAKDELLAYLTPGQSAQVHACTAATLTAAQGSVEPHVLERAAGWLTGAEHYSLAARSKPRPGALSEPVAAAPPDVSYVYCRGLAWRNLLVSNSEFCGLLNRLHEAGLPNTTRGTHLLVTQMPHERGGRLRFDPASETWSVSRGFEHHPVYWVTWIGAAVFALINSARLPAHHELCVLAAGTEPSNHTYAIGDVAPVAQPQAPLGIHHPVGNVQVWCEDGPPPLFGQPAQKWIHGAAWNTPATRDEIVRLRSRHLLGSSRGVGIRLVRDLSAPFTGPSVQQLAAALGVWAKGLTDRDRSLSEIDGELLAILSEPDVALRPHVGAAAGPA